MGRHGMRHRRARPPPRPTPTPHVFQPSDLPEDHRGRRFCGRPGCGLPDRLETGQTHPVHDPPPAEDPLSPRILGEATDAEDGSVY